MNDSQKRREELLKNTRKLYGLEKNGSHVHPRYRAEYKQEDGSSLSIRMLFSMILFLLFVFAERYDADLYSSIAACIIGK